MIQPGSIGKEECKYGESEKVEGRVPWTLILFIYSSFVRSEHYIFFPLVTHIQQQLGHHQNIVCREIALTIA